MRTHVKIHTDCNNNKSRCSSSSRKKVTLGLFLVAAGILLILGRSGLIEPKHMEYIFSWQSLLVALGVLFLISNPRSVVFSSILILVGGFFLYSEIVSLPIETRNIFWPIILVLLGLVMIFKRFSHKTPKKTFDHVESFSDEYVDKNIVFGGSKTVVTSKNFRGGSISTVFGGCELILTEAGLAEGDNVLNINAVFGGISIVAPRSWDIVIEVDGIMGGFKDDRSFVNPDNIDRSRRLIIKGSAVFGGGEIKNV